MDGYAGSRLAATAMPKKSHIKKAEKPLKRGLPKGAVEELVTEVEIRLPKTFDRSNWRVTAEVVAKLITQLKAGPVSKCDKDSAKAFLQTKQGRNWIADWFLEEETVTVKEASTTSTITVDGDEHNVSPPAALRGKRSTQLPTVGKQYGRRVSFDIVSAGQKKFQPSANLVTMPVDHLGFDQQTAFTSISHHRSLSDGYPALGWPCPVHGFHHPAPGVPVVFITADSPPMYGAPSGQTRQRSNPRRMNGTGIGSVAFFLFCSWLLFAFFR